MADYPAQQAGAGADQPAAGTIHALSLTPPTGGGGEDEGGWSWLAG